MYPKYKGYEIKPTRTADKEMAHLKIYLDDVLTILEEGKDASRSKRKSGTIEKALRIRGRMIKVVTGLSDLGFYQVFILRYELTFTGYNPLNGIQYFSRFKWFGNVIYYTHGG